VSFSFEQCYYYQQRSAYILNINKENFLTMPIRKAEAQWTGDLLGGKGSMKLGSGAYEGPYSFQSRMEEGTGTNPEELIGAAHAGCFSMALSYMLSTAGYPPNRVQTSAKVRFDKVGEGFSITEINLETKADVPGIDEKSFQEHAEKAKVNCPVSKALAGTKINLKAELVQSTATS
jgi:lipoyl-dependent peroxiredoxin